MDEERSWSIVLRTRAASWLLKGSRLPLIAAVLSVLLASPALGVGWVLDDYFHRAILLQRPMFRELLGSPWEMFRFFRGDPERMGRVLDLGLFPWWTDRSVKGEFLQTVTVLTHRLDYVLWPDSPVLMHVHNLFWLGASVALTACFYRRMFGPSWIVVVAALLYAMDDARGPTVGFIANRNVLIAATFGVSALLAHDRWRRGGSTMAAILAPLLLGAALFTKEEGIGTCAYLAAYAVLLDQAGRWRGCVALAPCVAVVMIWRALRTSWGYGVKNVGYYIDPLDEPGRFLAAAVQRIPIQLLGQWTPIPAEIDVVLGPRAHALLLGLAVAFLALVAYTFAPLLRRDPLARFWASGMVFATIPVAATLAMDRLLTFAGIGAFGLLAQFWAFVFTSADGNPVAYIGPRVPPVPRPAEDHITPPLGKGGLGGWGASVPNSSRLWRVLAKALACFFIVVHVLIAPLVFPFRAANPLGPRWIEQRFYVPHLTADDLPDRTLVIVNAPSVAHAGYLIFRQDLAGLPVPKHTRVLAPAIPSVSIRRTDERTLEVTPQWGYLKTVLDRIFRNEFHAIPVGGRVELSGMTAEVQSLTADGRPNVVRFRFDVPLESPSLRWLCFHHGGFESFTPPAVGESITIPFDWRAALRPGRAEIATGSSRF